MYSFGVALCQIYFNLIGLWQPLLEQAIKKGVEYRKPTDVTEHIHTTIRALIEQCLALDPESRPTAEEAQKQLRNPATAVVFETCMTHPLQAPFANTKKSTETDKTPTANLSG